jgi:ABC-type phosphate transport system substrate-binding protein
LTATLITLYSAPAAAAQVAIIANKSVPIDSVTQSQVLDIYTGELRRWKNGSPIVAYDLTAEGTVRDQFYEFIGRKSSRIKSIWMKNLLMGEGSPPESLKTEEDVIGRVAKTPGAIGFVRPEMTNNSVKILAVVSPPPGSD